MLTIREDIKPPPGGQGPLRDPREWQTPPAKIHVIIQPNAWALAICDPSDQSYVSLKWPATPAYVAADVRGLLEHFEAFREANSAYLNAIDPDDLRDRLGRFQPVERWSEFAGLRSGWYRGDDAHRDAWLAVAGDIHLRRMARAGHRLYQKIFADDRLKALVDALEPGGLLSVNWPSSIESHIPNFPWALLYKVPPPDDGPVDPTQFLGLRHRIASMVYPSPNSARDLGKPGEVHRRHIYLWKGPATDPALAEAARQHEAFRKLDRYASLPDHFPGDGLTSADALRLLRDPGPSPTTLLYLFCHCDLDDRDHIYLSFGAKPDPDVKLEYADMPTDPLADNPLVFVNACRSAAPGRGPVANMLEADFFLRKCRAYLGSVNKVPPPLAARFAEAFFHFLYGAGPDPAPMAAGEAVAQARLFLWLNYWNIGGLFYNYVNEYKLYMADDAGVQALYPYHREP